MTAKTTESEILSQFSQLRQLVAFLGSKKLQGWWDCSFMDEIGLRYMATTFPRSAAAAALNATIEAAQRTHDEALGRVGCFHLFRLPNSIEERLVLDDSEQVNDWNAESAISALALIADASIKAPEGPVQIGQQKRILSVVSVQEIAAHYLSAFQQEIKCYPYFSAQD